MNKELLEELKTKLEEEKKEIEKELKTFAKKDPKLKGDWDTVFPKFSQGTSNQEETTDEVEEYVNQLPVEFTLETRLQKIDIALEKVEKGKYGICEKCNKKIPIERLKVYPEGGTCEKCK